MSKDPFEELFGPEIHENDTPPQPVSARDRLAQERSAQVRTSQLPATRGVDPVASRDVQPGGAGRGSDRDSGEGRGAQAKPWIVVAVIAVLAIVGSLVIVNMVRGADASDEAEHAPGPQQTTQPTAPEETADPSQPEEPEQQPDEKPEEDGPPKVDVGTTGPIQVGDWGVTGQISEKFGWPSFAISGDNLILEGSPLINSLPDSCAGDWGVTKTGERKFEALKPATRCEAAPELYDELWGLTAELAKTFK